MLLEKVKDFSYSVQPYFSNDSNMQMAEDIQMFLDEIANPFLPINVQTIQSPPPPPVTTEYYSVTPPTLAELFPLQLHTLDEDIPIGSLNNYIWGNTVNPPNYSLPPPDQIPLMNPTATFAINFEYDLSDPEDLYLLDVDSMDEDSISDSNSVSSIDAESIADSSSNGSVDGESIIDSHSENDDVVT